MGRPEDGFDALRREHRRWRNKLSKIAGASLVTAGLVLAIVFLVFLYLSPKGPIEVTATIAAVVVAAGLFFWGVLKLI